MTSHDQSAAPRLLEARGLGSACWPAADVDAGFVMLLRDPASNAPPAATNEIWRCYVGADAASIVFDWMAQREEEWPCWARVATLFGDVALRSLVVGPATKAAEDAAIEAEERRIEEAERARLRDVVELFILDPKGKRPGLSLENADESKPFFKMTFSERWERERVLDWLRWQRDRFLEFRDVCLNDGSVALERLILAGMREGEAAAKVKGVSAGGRRPLRFWRGEA